MDPELSNRLFGLGQRTILITGACGGLGTAITKALLEAGADVVCTDVMAKVPHNEQWNDLDDLARSLGRDLSYRRMDVTKEEDVESAFETPPTRYPIRGLVCCAGLSGRGPSTEFPVAQARKIMEINFTGTFLCARTATKYFQAKAVPGSIVMVASMSGYVSNRGVDTAAYNSSKAALHQLARSLAVEWGRYEPPIRVNTLSPGYILTEATRPTLRELPHLERIWSDGNALGRLSEPEEYRGPILFLLGDGSSFMTGSDLRVDGRSASNCP